ncbi:arginine--tRNA ligase [Methanobacterium sp. CWC-01]|uniref:arginine--tRNA ligase n=1 Tax=Methanobacterium aridiramus TaxID=2584467 RepID=UPI002577541B|nr:arginine--tRNA ligase [Methanobacterium sp. CWC-01]WJI09487.1 arginine--tRNA ligase [Methanobacterium sp. CWC-01]
MYRKLENQAAESVKASINKLQWGVEVEIKFEQPPNPNMGDLATNVAFQLAGKLKRSPSEISENIMDNLELPPLIDRVEARGPYLNFFLDHAMFFREVLESVDEGYGQLELQNDSVILEHTSANPNGPLHIGHIRNAIIGDSLARVLRAGGYPLETQYYVNDMGRQIAMIVWGLQNLDYQLDPEEKPDVEMGKLYFQVNQTLNANPEIKTEIDAILKTYEQEFPPQLEELFREVVDKCLEGVKETSQRLHIHHDKFVWESQFIREGKVDAILEELKDYTQENEVLYLNLNQFGIEKELILRRSDGTSLYSTRDLAYHEQKAEEANISIDILGSDHKLALEQLSVVLELVGCRRPEVIFYEFITLPEGSMSTRRGVFISVDDLMDEAVKRALEELENRRPELNGEEQREIAEIIGVGAIRFYIARLSPEKHIVFKWDEALSFERGCASIQYAHARACKILEKASYPPEIEVDADDLEDLDQMEIELIKTIARFTRVIEESAAARRVHPVAQYTLELAGVFNRFYKSMPVLGSGKEDLRLMLVDKSRITIRNSLALLGIESPVSM